MEPKRTTVFEALGVALLLAAAVAAMGFTFSKRLNLLDEGFIMYASERVAHGQLPYRDFFTLLMPGTFCLHALLFKVFGTSLMVGRWAVFLVGVSLPMATYACSRRIMGPLFSLIAGLLTVVWGVSYGSVIPTYSWYGSLLSLVSLWLALTAAERGWGRRETVLVGVGLGLTILFKQNFGVYAGTAFLIYAALHQRRDARKVLRTWATILLPAAAVILPFAVWVALGGGLRDMIKDTVLFPIGPFKDNMALPYQRLWPLLSTPGLSWDQLLQAAKNGVAAIPVVYGAFALMWIASCARSRSLKADGSLLVLLFAALMILGAFPRADISHILFPMPAGFIVLAATLATLVKGLKGALGSAGSLAGTVLVAVIVAPLLWAPVRDTVGWNAYATYPIEGWSRANGISMQQGEAESTKQVLDQIGSLTMPGDYVFVIPWAAMFYFLSDRENPTRYDLIIPGNFDYDGETEMIEDLEDKQPRYVIHGFAWDVDGKRFEDYAPRLHQYIRSNYASLYFVGQYEFLERVY